LKTGSADELEKLFFPISVTVGSGIDEENQIKAWLDTFFVQAENFPNLAFRTVSFNGIPEFLG